MAPSTYTVTKPILHDKLLYRANDPVQLTEKQAAPLKELGAVTPGEPKAASTSAPVALAAETLGKLNLAELTTYAQAHGVTVATDATKAQIIDALTPKA